MALGTLFVIKLNNIWESSISTTAFRTAAIVVAVFTLVAAAIMWFVSQQTNLVLTQQVLAALSSETELLRAEERSSGLVGLRRAVALRSRTAGSGLYFLGDEKGTRLAGNLSEIPKELLDHHRGAVFSYPVQRAGSMSEQGRSSGPARRTAVGVLLSFGGAQLVVARDVEDQRVLSHRIRLVSLIGFGLLGIGGLLAGLLLSRLVLSRVNEITEASRAIMAGNLSERLPRSGTGDEFDRLAGSLNEMLARIEQLMLGLREVSDNIAHDLKTPLNRLRNRAEEALRDPRGAQAQRQGLERTIEAADDLIKTFNALLLIARLEAGAIDETLEDTDLREVVRDVTELYEPVATDAGFNLSVTFSEGGDLNVPINRQLIGQSIANLLENAIKYSVSGLKSDLRKTSDCVGGDGQDEMVLAEKVRSYRATAKDISVSVTPVEKGVEISVGDRGAGIAPEDRERVLRRFVRLEKSRTAPGTGLGLSLVAAVARLHGGKVRLEDNEPGLRVVVFLPSGKGRSGSQQV